MVRAMFVAVSSLIAFGIAELPAVGGTMGAPTLSTADGFAFHFAREEPSECTVQCWDQHSLTIHYAPSAEENATNEEGGGPHAPPNWAEGLCEEAVGEIPAKHPACGGGGANGNGNGNGGGSDAEQEPPPALALLAELEEAVHQHDMHALQRLLGDPAARVMSTRSAVQVHGCYDEVIGHLSVPPDLLQAVAAAD